MMKLASIQFLNVPPIKCRYAFIPWDVHIRVYDGYSRRYGFAQSAERINERGGFSVNEILDFYPQWDRIIYYSKDKYTKNIDELSKVKI